MARFKLKAYSTQVTKGLKYLKENPALPLSVASLGLMVHNTRVNTKSRQQDMNYRTKQLDAMNGLTNRLDLASGAIENASRILNRSINENTKALQGNTDGNRYIYENPHQVSTQPKKQKKGLFKSIFSFGNRNKK
jgi:hypothetical protein